MISKEIIQQKLIHMLPIICMLLEKGYKVELSRSRSGVKIYYGKFHHVDVAHTDVIRS